MLVIFFAWFAPNIVSKMFVIDYFWLGGGKKLTVLLTLRREQIFWSIFIFLQVVKALDYLKRKLKIIHRGKWHHVISDLFSGSEKKGDEERVLEKIFSLLAVVEIGFKARNSLTGKRQAFYENCVHFSFRTPHFEDYPKIINVLDNALWNQPF